MKVLAFVKSLSEDIEEEVTLILNNIELIGFIGYCPYPIEEGKMYLVEISLSVFDNFEIKESLVSKYEFIRLDNGFKYKIRGKLLEGGRLDVGITLEDTIFTQYEYLIDKYVEIEVDRLNVEFLD